MSTASLDHTSELSRSIETFGFDNDDPWALDTLRLLFSTPRAFKPLVSSWQERNPWTSRALARLVDAGFADYQEPLIVDLRTGKRATRPTRSVTRWRITNRGRRHLDRYLDDPATFLVDYRNTHDPEDVVALLGAFDLTKADAQYGISAQHATELAGIDARKARRWIDTWENDKMITKLDVKLADTREVVPAHWRVNRQLCRQLRRVLKAYRLEHIGAPWRLAREKFLDDIDPARFGMTGASDYEHDIETQRIVADLIRSPRFVDSAVFGTEPRFVMPTTVLNGGVRAFDADGESQLFYQPDAELRATDEIDGRRIVRRVYLEYERFQSRRDAWSHLERFLGHLHLRALPFEHAALLFVVETERRLSSYVELIEAFVDHLIEHPERNVANPVMLCVSSSERVAAASDPLNLATWNRIAVPSAPAETTLAPHLHTPTSSPYGLYFQKNIPPSE